MKHSKLSGHLRMRLFWLPVVLMADWMPEIWVKVERNHLRKTQEMGLQNCSCIAVTLPRYLISPRIPTTLGWSVLYQKTMSSRVTDGKEREYWQRPWRKCGSRRTGDLVASALLMLLDSPSVSSQPWHWLNTDGETQTLFSRPSVTGAIKTAVSPNWGCFLHVNWGLGSVMPLTHV